MIIDVHCHYVFSRRCVPDAERFSFERTPPEGEPLLDSFVSPRILRRISWRLMSRMLGVRPPLIPGPAIDAQMDEVYARHLLADGPIERYVLLAFDRHFERDGRCAPIPERSGAAGSDIYSSNTLIRAACRARPDRFLLGASIHPYRPGACEALEEVAEAGACLVKWLPLHQNIDVGDARTLDFLRSCARLALPILAHYGDEFTLATNQPALRSVLPLLEALRGLRREGRMPPVIVAHVSTPNLPWGDVRSHEALLEALEGEFADAPLYADISALTVWPKIKYLRRLARRQELHHKLVFGSDFPVPLGLPRLRWDLGREWPEIRAERSWPQQAARVVRALGYNEIVLQQAQRILRLRNGAADAPSSAAHAGFGVSSGAAPG